MTYSLFITCTPGLEEVLFQEVTSLNFSPEMGGGGVYLDVPTFRDVMFLNLALRTGTRVLLHLLDIDNPTKDRLYSYLYDSDMVKFFKTLPTFAFDVPFSEHPDFRNTLYVKQLAKDALCDRLVKTFGKRPNVETKNPEIRFHVVLREKKASLFLDTSLEPLFKRGYRLDGGDAPLQETLAASLLALAGYNEDKILVDPCCGTGTFLIEAAFQLTKTAPGLLRNTFGLSLHPEFDYDMWISLRKELRSKILPLPENKIIGIEKDKKTYRLLLKALARAHLIGSIKTYCEDFRDVQFSPLANFVISNPPFGYRLGNPQDHFVLYKELGNFMKRKTEKPAVGGILTVERYQRAINLTPTKSIPINHGGLDCIFLVFDLYDTKKPSIHPSSPPES
jgi:putative N6-adenine-specific DNA methylase